MSSLIKPGPAEVSPEQEKALKLARKRAADVRDFYVHLMIYVTVNAGLFVIDVLGGDGWWFDWIAIPWGVFLVAHAVTLFTGRFLGAEWEQRKVAQYLRRGSGR